MASIGSLIFDLIANGAGLIKSVEVSAAKAGDAGAAAMGTRLTAGLKKWGALALSGAFAGAAGALTQLDTAVKQYSADVGASAEETERAKDIAQDLFRTNRQGYGEILGALAKLRTDQGASVEQLEMLGQAYLRFSRVAKIDAAGAVTAFDDILDAFNRDVTDGVQIMDLLVGSNQRYGGSLQQRLVDLKNLAPQLQGLNLTLEDGIALQNLFAESGLDASRATFALNTAIRNLKPGETFDALIARISAIEDPTLRAQAAIEVFGARGGVALAQALRPGITSLDDFALTAEETADDLKVAVEKIDSSIPAQFELAIKNLGGAVLSLAEPAGPLLLMAGSLTILARELGVATGAANLFKVSMTGLLSRFGLVGTAVAAGVVSYDAFSQAVDRGSEAQRKAAAAVEERAAAEGRATTETERYFAAYGEVVDAEKAGIPVNQLMAEGYGDLWKQAETAADRTEGLADATAALRRPLKEATDAAGVFERILGEDVLISTQRAGSGILHLSDNVRGLRQDALDAVDALAQLARSTTGRGTGISERIAAQGDDPGATARAQANLDFAEDQRRRAEERAAEARRRAGASSTAASRAASDATVAEERRLRELADTARTRVGSAFDALRDIATRVFDRIHEKNLRAIEDARALAHETNDARLSEAEAAQDAIETARRRRDLVEELAAAQRAVAEAQTPEDQAAAVRRLRSASEALQSFQAQADIARIRGEVETANALADQQAEAATARENTRFERERTLFEAEIAKIEQLALSGNAQAHSKLMALFKTFGLDYETAGKNLGQSFANGLRSKAAAVEAAAKALAAIPVKYLKTGSPAEVGPLRDSPPDAMGARVGASFGEALAATIEAWRAKVAAAIGGVTSTMTAPAMSPGAVPDMSGGVRGIAAAGIDSPLARISSSGTVPASAIGTFAPTIVVDLGSEFSRLFGTDRFIRTIDRELQRFGS